MADDPLARIRARFPDEVAAAEQLAAEQATALGEIAAGALSFTHPVRTHDETRSTAGTSPAPIRPDDVAAPVPYWSLTRIGAAFADGTLTPPAYLAALIDRIDVLDARLHAFVMVDRDGAHAAAQASAARWRSGQQLGPLDGIPVGVKDVIDVAGLPTRCHSRVTPDVPAARDAAIVARLREAGAVIVGKLATHEFAIGGPAFDLPFPPARNPWNTDHHPGGSSSGAGTAVAAGLLPLAIGTDTAGSVRNPASACGIVGLKPGRGLLSVEGVVPLAPTLDHVGLLTRTVEDMRIATAVLGVTLYNRPVGRVGYVRHFHTADMIATPDVAAALDRAAASVGATEVTLPPLTQFALVNRIILQAEGYAAHGHRLRERPADLSYLTRAALLPGAFTSTETFELAISARAMLTTAVDTAFRDVDVLLTASSMAPPCRIDDPVEIARSYMLQARTPFNVTGHPALTVPVGLAADGLPLSVQLAARMGEEGRLLAAGALIERSLPPPIA